MAACAFIGLGVMGFPMAGHLQRAGHALTVYNRTPERAARWVAEYNGRSAPSIAEAVAGADFVFTCVGADPDVQSVTGEAFPAMRRGAILIDHTTASARLARDLAGRAAETGLGFLDAPLSGGQAGAEQGKLTIMVGGDAAFHERAASVMQAYAKAITHIGGPGAGQLAKMVNQICVAGVVQGLAEGLAFGMAAGLDLERVIQAISKGAAQSWQMENRWATMVQGRFDFGFAVDWMRKDLGMALDEARANGARLELTELVDRFYAEIQGSGGRRWDTSSLIARLTKPAE